MKHLLLFEKFGINKNLEEQSKVFFKEISENKLRNIFDFIYKNETGNYPFNVKINLKEKTPSFYITRDKKTNKIEKLEIELVDREDYSTFLHELKHLDYGTRKVTHNDVFYKTGDKLSHLKSNKLIMAWEIFYLFDDDEFQARYHGYYADFDNYLSNNISNNPTPNEIKLLFNNFLKQTDDPSWTWYSKINTFKFEEYLNNSEINQLFHKFVVDKYFYLDEYDNIFKYLKTQLKKIIKPIFNNYSKHEISIINREKKNIENEINKRIIKFRKKLYKLIPLMVDKWVK